MQIPPTASRNDWKTQQMIKASGWPLAPELLAPGNDFSVPLEGGLVPLLWAIAGGKTGPLQHMLEHGADLKGHALGSEGLLALALQSANYQTLMTVIDQLKANGSPPPGEALKQQLTHTFRASHTNARNRLQQTLRDWERISKAA